MALDCSSSPSCCSRALETTSAPPDTDLVFTALKVSGIFHAGGPAQLTAEEAKPWGSLPRARELEGAGGLQEGQMRHLRERRCWQGMWVR